MSSGTIGFNNSAQSNVIEAVKFLFAGCDDASKAHRYFTFASYSKKTPTDLETIPPSIFPTDLLEFENSILFLSFVLIDRVLLRPLSHPMHRVSCALESLPLQQLQSTLSSCVIGQVVEIVVIVLVVDDCWFYQLYRKPQTDFLV
jgi:hypothetical protein